MATVAVGADAMDTAAAKLNRHQRRRASHVPKSICGSIPGPDDPGLAHCPPCRVVHLQKTGMCHRMGSATSQSTVEEEYGDLSGEAWSSVWSLLKIKHSLRTCRESEQCNIDSAMKSAANRIFYPEKIGLEHLYPMVSHLLVWEP